jgi:predicted anti-sigma-YlaC factor YlaD
MMDHEQYRRALLADPSSNDQELETHRANCEACRAFTDQVNKFEHILTHALKINVPNGVNILPFHAHRAPLKSNRWWALAASVATAFCGRRRGIFRCTAHPQQ